MMPVISTKHPTVNAEGRGDVVQHSHPDEGWVQFCSGSLTASQDFILIDISDTTNYPHTNTNYVHLSFMRVHADSTSSGDYVIQIGYLANVDGTNGDFYAIAKIDGNKTVGQIKDQVIALYPNGPRCTSSRTVAANKSLNDTAFQTDVNLATTLDPATSNTPSGNGDLVLRMTVSAGTVSVCIDLSYHSH